MRLDGAEVRRIRTEIHGMTVTDLAAKIGYGERTVQRAESGTPVASVTAARIALALGVNMRDLLPRKVVAS